MRRLISPRYPWNGVSHIATTGKPRISLARCWIMSKPVHVGQEVDGRRSVAEFVHEVAHARHLPRRNGDEDDVDIAVVHEGRDVVEAAEQLRGLRTAEPVAAAIVEEARHRDTELDVQRQPPRELHARLGDRR